MDVNTTSVNPTHFLRGVELIDRARGKYSVPSENWCFPTQYKFGTPCERYYAEIWTDGMDWQPSYWVIEEKELEKPVVYPFMIFEYNEHRQIFIDYDFDQLIKACLYYRRDKYWINHNDWGIYTDLVWPHLYIIDDTVQFGMTRKYGFEHASQPFTAFWLNYNFIPEEYREKPWKDYRNNRDPKAGHICCFPGNN